MIVRRVEAIAVIKSRADSHMPKWETGDGAMKHGVSILDSQSCDVPSPSPTWGRIFASRMEKRNMQVQSLSEYEGLVLEAIYLVRDIYDGPVADLSSEWLDQVITVCEVAVNWVMAAPEVTDEAAAELARGEWVERVGEEDERGWQQVVDVAEALKEGR